MSRYVGKQYTVRHGIPFDAMPTTSGYVWLGGGSEYQTVEEYGSILDCTYEMADMVACSNGWTMEQSIRQVLTDEGWRMLPSHQKLICTLLKEIE